MSGKSVDFGDKNIKKVNFTNKRYLRYMTLILIKYYVLKKNHMAQKFHSNILLDVMVMINLDLYA